MNKLNKKQCVNAKNRLRSLAYTTCDCKEDNIHEVMVCGAILEQIIKEYFELKEKVDSIQDLFDNKPYEFEELEDEVEYYDNLHKRHVLISFASRGEKHAYSCGFHVPEVITRSNFKPNRFYPREVKENESNN